VLRLSRRWGIPSIGHQSFATVRQILEIRSPQLKLDLRKIQDPGHFWLGSPKLRLHSLVRQFQVVQVDLVRILFEIAVHLKIHGDSIPARAWAILKRPIQGRGLPV